MRHTAPSGRWPKFLHPVFEETLQSFRTAENRLAEASVDKGIGIALELLIDQLENADALFGRNQPGIQGDQLTGYLAVYFRVVIFVEELLAAVSELFGCFTDFFLFPFCKAFSRPAVSGMLENSVPSISAS